MQWPRCYHDAMDSDPIAQALAALRQRDAALVVETDRVREAIASLVLLLPAQEPPQLARRPRTTRTARASAPWP